jgi:hypothetical protein
VLEDEDDLAWRNIIVGVFSKALEKVVSSCIEGEDAERCAESLIAAADAVYSPLKPVDSGLGEARRIASRLAGVIANAVLVAAREKGVEDKVKAAYEILKEKGIEGDYRDLVKTILNEAGAALYEPATSKEARETVLSDLKAYFEPEQEQFVLRRRRRQTPKPANPQSALRRLIRELGRYDPMLARQIVEELKATGIRF